MTVHVGVGAAVIAAFFLALLLGYAALVFLAALALVLIVEGVKKMLGR